ncbi:MAG: caspase family protein [Bacteroidota bacterium]
MKYHLTLLFIFCCIIQASKGQNTKLTAQIGHEGRASYVTINPSHSIIATTASDGIIKLWDIASGRILRSLDGHTSKVNAISFSYDGNLLVSGSYDKTIKVWEVNTGIMLQNFIGHDSPVQTVAFSPDDLIIASGSGDFSQDSSDTSIKIWEVLSGKLIQTFEGHQKSTSTLTFNSNGRYLVSGGWDNNVILWSIAKKKKLREYNGHTEKVNTVKFNPDGMSFASCSQDNSIKTWDIISGELLHTLQNNLGNPNSFSYSDNGKYIISGGINRQINLWRSQNGKLIKNYPTKLSWITSVAYNPKGKIIASGNELEKTVVLDVEKGEQLCKLIGYSKKITSLAFNAKGDQLAIVNNGKDILLWDMLLGKITKKLQGHQSEIRTISFNPTTDEILSGSADKSVISWQPDKDGNYKTFKAHRKGVFSIAHHPNGQLFASGSADGTIILWDKNSNIPIDTLFGRTSAYYEPAWDIHFSPNGKFLLSAGHNQLLKIWDITNGKLLAKAKAHKGAVRAVTTSKDGQFIYTAGHDKVIRKWAGNGSIVKEFFSHKDEILCLQLHPKENIIASAGRDKHIVLWDASTGEVLKELKGHDAAINQLAFSPDGKFLVSAGNDSRIIFWDLVKKRELATLIILENGTDYAIVTKRGYFEGSIEGIKNALHFVKGNEISPLESYFEKFFTPELWLRIMNGEDPNAMEFNIFEFVNIPNDVEFNDPSKLNKQVRFDTKSRIFKSDKEEVQIALETIDNGGGIDEIRVYQNGKLIHTTGTAFKNKPNEGENVKLEITTTLIEGANRFSTMAFNNERTESMHDIMNITYDSPYKPQADLYVICIGINDYLNPSYQLNVARKDAQEFAQNLQKGSSKIFRNIKPFEVYDTLANALTIRKVLDSVAITARPNDVFVFYYAGHGALADASATRAAEYFLIPYDVTQVYGAEDQLIEKAISSSELMEFSRKIKAQKQLIILDACQSGGAIKSFVSRGPKEQKAMMQLARSAGVVLLAASGQEEFASEYEELGHGVFTYSILEAMKGNADGGLKDKKITVNELKGYLEDRVPQLSEKFRGKPQYPTGYSRGQDFPIVIVE